MEPMRQWSRREFIQFVTVGTTAGIAGCNALPGSDPTQKDSSTPEEDGLPGRNAEEGVPVSGNVVGIYGSAISDATIDVIVPKKGVVDSTTTDQQGRFEVGEPNAPVWVRATAPGYLQRTVAAAPIATRRIALTPRDGTVSLTFGGDVMFGRRFYQDDDPLEPHLQIQPDERSASHDTILQYVSPLFGDADITSINLETPLTTTAWRHPSKLYSFVSHPDAAAAMSRAGIDYAALGNNHTLDALPPGLDDTFQALSDAGVKSSGAGESSTAAWEPTYFDVQGLTVGMLSCTTVTGDQYDIDWSAEDGQSETYTVGEESAEGTPDSETLTFSGSVGVAAATEPQLSEHVAQTTSNADLTVVQIHGGNEYQPKPTEQIEQLTESAISAGADVVVNHHPHVTGGVERRDGALVAWTLGNLVFDQELWSTFPSYLLTVHATRDGVIRAYVDPLLIEGYVPKGIVGKPKTWQLRNTAALSSDEFSLDERTLEYVDGKDSTTQTVTRTLNGEGTIFERKSGWIDRVPDGQSSVELGRDLLPTGTFDNSDIDDERYEGALWRFSRGEDSNGPRFGYGDSGGIQLTRRPDNTQRKILTTASRVPLAGPTTLLGQYQHESNTRLELLVRWYESTSGSALDSVSIDLGQTTGWERLRQSLDTPDTANYVRIYFRLYPPDGGDKSVARLDDIRLVEWSDTDGDGGQSYDHLRVQDTVTIEFGTTATSGDNVSWSELT